ncbi:MAG: phytanoyl-CoA dioxygenase family protein [Tetrasphaera jenkinsii]|jgi:ectoine hydroxylase-related dioxygenase (phytanoyl-CoA dioxygenase family)|nr:phytanoyl-CoA dioxygenase family protein [Tetrasphaera jenkinsii]
MSQPTTQPRRNPSLLAGRLRPEDCRLADLLEILRDTTDLADYPTASTVEHSVLMYDAPALRAALAEGRSGEIEAELVRAWSEGPGIVVIRGAFSGEVIGRVNAAYDRILKQEKETGAPKGDHFGEPGANDRIWNALEKLAVVDPQAFVDYYSNDLVALGARAWLGPGYQVTVQPNIVRPGGKGQTVHRDYHLGFMDPEQGARFPAHVHALSPALTLQGAVAHVDMPVESGPTLYLPHSQKYSHGYLAYWLPEFQDYFVGEHGQLPLALGDLVWFNPALMHAAGTNVSVDVQRMANLLQVSSAFGRAMETVDRQRVVTAIYPALLAALDAGMPRHLADNVVAASAEGYAFPSNLDRDQPVGGMAPPTQADLLRAAVETRLPPAELGEQLALHAWTRLSH